ncbi:MAG: hypothetical protein DHS20C20_30240 [Ardenticatenaceae bacterium]|nr:MAG: hypothetical protein DHS20C20_30240 [Ardenticatenaceae bacterium]
MPDIPKQESREERYGKTQRKHVSLSHDAVEAIQTYADQQKMNFSVAVESLAKIGLGDKTSERLPRLTAALLEHQFNKQFNRFAKLIAYTAIASEEANYKSDLLLMQTVWREAQRDPNNFVANMQVSDNPDVQPDAAVREIRNDLRADAHEYAVTRLRRPLKEIIAILSAEVSDAANE